MKKLLSLFLIILSISCDKKNEFVRPPDAKGMVSLDFKGAKTVFDLFYVNHYLDVDRIQNVHILCRNNAQKKSQDEKSGEFYLYDFQLERQKGSRVLNYTSIINPENKITIQYTPEIKKPFRMKGSFNGTLDLYTLFDNQLIPNDEKQINLDKGIFDLDILRRV